jgi:hypothetical protein
MSPTWLVTSGHGRRAVPPPTSLVIDDRLAASAHRHVTAPDRFFVEPALIDCDALVDTRRVRAATAPLDAVEMSNDIRCTAPSSTSHRLAQRRVHRPSWSYPRPHHRRWIHRRRHGSAVSWLHGSTHRHQVAPVRTAAYGPRSKPRARTLVLASASFCCTTRRWLLDFQRLS